MTYRHIVVVALLGTSVVLEAGQRFDAEVERHVELGRAVAAMGELDRAAKHYEQALEQTPESKPLLFSLGGLYQKMGANEKAEEVYRRVLSLYPKDAEGHVCLGNVLLAQKKFELAAKEFSAALETDRGNAVAWRNLGFAELRAGAPFSAVKTLERAVALDPTNALARFDLGMAHAAVAQQAEAQKAFRSGLAIEASIEGKLAYTEMLDRYAGPRVEDARTAFGSNDFVRAEQILTNLVAEFPDYAYAYVHLGHTYHYQQPCRPAEAEAIYRRALDALAYTVLAPTDHAVLLDNLGMIRMNVGDYEEAEVLFRRGVALDTRYPVVYFNFGCIMARQKAYETAAVAFADAIRRDRQCLDYLNHHVALGPFRSTAAYSNLLNSVRKEK